MLEVTDHSTLSQMLLQEVKTLADRFQQTFGRIPSFMEVCGSHTMALARTGVKKALEGYVRLISGPGCPVCVTDQVTIDAMISLTDGVNRIICTFGDMVRVPGSYGTLMQAKTEGKDVRVVYSPVDAVRIAEQHPHQEVIFLGIGFETTIPILAAAVKEAEEKQVRNFSMWMSTKLVEPILRQLLHDGEVALDGFLLPGHVSMVMGRKHFEFLATEYNIPAVISGFEALDMLSALRHLLLLSLEQRAVVLNDYKSVVTEQGNVQAKYWMNHYFTLCDEAWRGIGVIFDSGMDFKSEYNQFNAKVKFPIPTREPRRTKCRCGEVIRGLIDPPQCALFGRACTPLNPIGPCMVSSEGSCAAYYQYMREE
ncbi:hydrogenase formation protein, HypA family [Anoxybacillus flavithermus TNO-09.006]|uniref:(NiFe) hydrogenase metallocenter assembly protein HypD n=1 Tax=Anoxybacillus flavithermus TaxID=33934 RepID=A0A178T5B3_9BACL|nr:hydrogenase formation protein HypD [Anoxybacillus flavithermus]ELK21935.1 hydrogenase formation protein, HypA family [Anoxybacillus flavithermus TNO-09.006]MBE2932579.1 hydrogenase formation protein HypD [Anoxybacillus flavithermus]MBE2940335.1 hydrogenase formation protein HypD [Anoxybacillus flavithermus]MBE2942648.1 hydrogenase formation protein HypD [Anoxybacillus flavithermus]MBE2951058.1 hydrogenase formation protein HypD [Anoxybacillus flavithermus]